MRTPTPLAFASVILLPFTVQLTAQTSAALPDGNGKALVAAVCSQCHDLTPLFVFSGDDRRWEIVVHDMIAFGAQVSPQERDVILTYLKTSFSSQRPSRLLPPGKGQEVLSVSCTGCHGLPFVGRTRATRTEWDAILRRHSSEGRVKLNGPNRETLVAYLSEHLGR